MSLPMFILIRTPETPVDNLKESASILLLNNNRNRQPIRTGRECLHDQVAYPDRPNQRSVCRRKARPGTERRITRPPGNAGGRKAATGHDGGTGPPCGETAFWRDCPD